MYALMFAWSSGAGLLESGRIEGREQDSFLSVLLLRWVERFQRSVAAAAVSSTVERKYAAIIDRISVKGSTVHNCIGGVDIRTLPSVRESTLTLTTEPLFGLILKSFNWNPRSWWTASSFGLLDSPDDTFRLNCASAMQGRLFILAA